jgi:hypothetical protein
MNDYRIRDRLLNMRRRTGLDAATRARLEQARVAVEQQLAPFGLPDDLSDAHAAGVWRYVAGEGWTGESSPAGRWILDRRSEEPFPEFKGARLIAGEPVVLLPGESDEIQLLDPSAGYFDYGAAVLKKQTTGRMSPAGFLSEFDVKEVQMSSTEVEPGSTYDYTLTRDTGETETKEDVTDETADVKFWSGIDRTRDVRLTIEETSAAGAGRKFDGVQFEIGVYGRPANPRRRV